jgi:hypothetical protein
LVFSGAKIFELLEHGTDFEHEGETGNIMTEWESSIKEAFGEIVDLIKDMVKDSK